MLLGDHFDCINPRRIKRQVFFNVGDCLVRFFVCPNGVFRFRTADGNAVVRTITLVRTIGVMLGPNQQRHVRIVARQVVNRRISLLLQSKRPRRFGHYSSGDRYTHSALSRRNRDGMIRPRNSDFLAFARFSLHCAPHGISYSFEPPSTGILAPVIHRALSEAKNATTSATSSDLPIRFSACIPSVTQFRFGIAHLPLLTCNELPVLQLICMLGKSFRTWDGRSLTVLPSLHPE